MQISCGVEVHGPYEDHDIEFIVLEDIVIVKVDWGEVFHLPRERAFYVATLISEFYTNQTTEGRDP